MRTTALLLTVCAASCNGAINQGGGPGADEFPSRDPRGTGPGGGTGTSPPSAGVDCTESPSPRVLRQLTRDEYEATLADLLAIARPDVGVIPPDNTVRGFSNNISAAFVSESHLDGYVTVAEQLAGRAIRESYAKVVPCQTQDAACSSAFIDAFGLRVFRRPLTAEEKGRYAKLFDPGLTGGDFKVGVELTIRSLLVSPHFLFRRELGTETAPGKFVLTPYEIASALSYTYWGSTPDDTLLAAAKGGTLGNRAEIEKQARRLLDAPRGRARIAHFFGEWLETSKIYVASKDRATYPKPFADPAGIDGLRDAMAAEQDAFVSSVVFDGTKKFGELFTANYTFGNDRLAAYYGLPPPGAGETVKKIPLPAGSQRGGLLTMGTFLFGHARTTASSPTQRGHLIRESILCEDIPPPPPNVDAEVKPGTPGKTSRQQISNLTNADMCQACHTLMDPIGFGLEGFDGVGAFRTEDNGEVVDATGSITGFKTASGADATFNGARELSGIIGGAAVARGCFATNYYRFARGFESTGVDSCAVDRLKQDFAKGDLDLPELFVRVSLQDSFITRRSAEVLEK